jgi:hypothetical protein
VSAARRLAGSCCAADISKKVGRAPCPPTWNSMALPPPPPALPPVLREGGGARVGSRRTEPRAAPAAVAVGRGRGEACAICWKRQFGVRSRASPAVRGTLQHWATKGRERRETETTSSERRKNPTETRRRIVVLPACGPAWKVYWAVRAG